MKLRIRLEGSEPDSGPVYTDFTLAYAKRALLAIREIGYVAFVKSDVKPLVIKLVERDHSRIFRAVELMQLHDAILRFDDFATIRFDNIDEGLYLTAGRGVPLEGIIIHNITEYRQKVLDGRE